MLSLPIFKSRNLGNLAKDTVQSVGEGHLDASQHEKNIDLFCLLALSNISVFNKKPFPDSYLYLGDFFLLNNFPIANNEVLKD